MINIIKLKKIWLFLVGLGCAVIGLVAYISANIAIDNDVSANSMGPNIGLGVVALTGEILSWLGIVVLVIATIVYFKNKK